eukprot:CAMPEP_0115845310 /NCGR_PEP_ID=MMETSP0287-20121206/9288_1 /TAXON_ID=412157 /ORGANISM="Chrysochromulina rotalis, Strain UIO044" /LENGTH=50 /DNA_ID=CAMNT_0003299083 /DNA_START=145 /DNA_END=294 /DNA_ORIENTATION=+
MTQGRVGPHRHERPTVILIVGREADVRRMDHPWRRRLALHPVLDHPGDGV